RPYPGRARPAGHRARGFGHRHHLAPPMKAGEPEAPPMKPDWWDEAGCALASRDPTLARLMRDCGEGHLVRRDDPFQALARSIVGQQISVAAAQAVWGRFAARARSVDPDRVSRMRVATLRACGLSARKAEYLKDLAGRFVSGEVDPAHWEGLSDDE